MCVVCHRFEERLAAGTVSQSLGAVAQLAERHDGIVEVRGSIPLSSTLQIESDSLGFMLGGVVAGEGSFYISRRRQRFVADDSDRLRFRFSVAMASRDRPLLVLLQSFLGVGTLRDVGRAKPHWQPISIFTVSSCTEHRKATIPFAERYLLPSAKRDQFLSWQATMDEYEQARLTKSRWGQGRSLCSVAGCERPVRGRGLCRSHYYRATGW